MAAMGYLNEPVLCRIDSKLELVDIQNHVYEEVKVIEKASDDSEGAVEIGLDKYLGGVQDNKKSASCCELWKCAFAWAVEGEVVDVEEFADMIRSHQNAPPLLFTT